MRLVGPRYVRSAETVLEHPLGDPVLVLPGNKRLGLSSEVAVYVVELCAEPRTVRDLTNHVVDLFDVEFATAERDIADFVETLVAEGALERLASPDDGGALA